MATHPGVRTAGIRWRKLATAVFGTVRVATESVPIPGAFSQQPKRDTRAGVVLLALSYKPRRRHQDEEHDDGEAMVSPPSTEFVSPGSLNRTGHIAFRGQYRKAAKGRARTEAKLAPKEAFLQAARTFRNAARRP
jgi:hypothetical protein